MRGCGFCLATLFWAICGPIASTSFAQDAPAPTTVQVVAAGLGRDEAGATKDALSNAVREAIGQFVSAEDLVQNDQLVRDQILTYSDGYVDDYKAIGDPKQTDGGLVSVTIRATVQRSKLLEKVRAANIAITDFNGKGLFAEVITKEQQRATGAALVAKEFKGVQAGLIKATVAGKPSYDERANKAIVPITIAIDDPEYNKFVKRAEQVLDQACVESNVVACQDNTLFGPGVSLVEGRVNLASLGRNSPNGLIEVCEQISNNYGSSRWKVYAVAPEIMKAVGETFRHLSVSVDLQDAQGNTVDSSNLEFNKYLGTNGLYLSTPITFGRDLQGIDWVIVAPVSGGPGGPGLLQSVLTNWSPSATRSRTVKLGFSLTPDQLQTVSTVRCAVNGDVAPSNQDRTDPPQN